MSIDFLIVGLAALLLVAAVILVSTRSGKARDRNDS